MNRTMIIVLSAAVALIFLVVIWNTFYIIDESHQVVITQFRKVIGDPITEPGLHMKIPFVHEANYFDKRLLDWEGDKTEVKDSERQFILVEVYARWRIADPTQYLIRVQGKFEIASSRLDAVIDPIVRNVIAENPLREVVRSDTEKTIKEGGTKTVVAKIPEETETSDESAYEVEVEPSADRDNPDADQEGDGISREEQGVSITVGREKIASIILERAKEVVIEYGIELVDVRFKRINYVPETRAEVFNRMVSERKKQSAKYLALGRGEAARIIGRKDGEVREIRSEAEEQVLDIIGEGEAKAIEIYKAAYDQDNTSRDFYKFYKTLETLKKTVGSDTWLILSTDSDLFGIIKSLEALR